MSDWRPSVAKVNVTAVLGQISVSQQRIGFKEYMVAQIHCEIRYRGRVLNTVVAVKQLVGSEFSDSDNIEVDKPRNYNGPLKWPQFATAVERHFKKAVGPEGKIIQSPLNIVMHNIAFDIGQTKVVMNCEDIQGAAW
jgi:hypothetical protein